MAELTVWSATVFDGHPDAVYIVNKSLVSCFFLATSFGPKKLQISY